MLESSTVCSRVLSKMGGGGLSGLAGFLCKNPAIHFWVAPKGTTCALDGARAAHHAMPSLDGLYKGLQRGSGLPIDLDPKFSQASDSRVVLPPLKGKWFNPLVVKDSFLRGSPNFSQKVAKRPPCFRRSDPSNHKRGGSRTTNGIPGRCSDIFFGHGCEKMGCSPLRKNKRWHPRKVRCGT